MVRNFNGFCFVSFIYSGSFWCRLGCVQAYARHTGNNFFPNLPLDKLQSLEEVNVKVMRSCSLLGRQFLNKSRSNPRERSYQNVLLQEAWETARCFVGGLDLTVRLLKSDDLEVSTNSSEIIYSAVDSGN